jgi:aryl-alcohol dehydrogenase-like predicted oxidoreductase
LAERDLYLAIAKEVGCTPAQFAIAWSLHKWPHLISILGTRSVAHLTDNMGTNVVKLSNEVMIELDALININTVHGNRYDSQAQCEVDTEFYAIQ